jgi:septal ring factor EnvC (AmiA/AmiB activator)
LDKVIEKARGFFASAAGKTVAVLLVLAAIVGYAHHRGVVSATAKLTTQIEQLRKQLADAEAKPAPEIRRDEETDADLADRLKQAETAKANLEKKVSDYEKQLARRPAKAGAFTLSPADARSLSNIK